MANISQNVNIEMLEKLPDGTYKRKYPKTRSDTGVTFDEHLADYVNFKNNIEAVKYEGDKLLLKVNGDWKGINIKALDPATWEDVQIIVRVGLASEFFEVGDQVMSNYDGGEIIWEVIGIDVDTPTDGQYQHSMTIQTKDCLEDRVFNSAYDNRYINSPIREYLNSEFLSKLDPELSAVLGEVDKKVAKRGNLGGGQDSFSDKVFLLSRVEVDLETEGTTTGEIVYPFYDGKGNANRVKNLDNTARMWWLRSPTVASSSTVRTVTSIGMLNHYDAVRSYGLSPACTIV